MSSPRLSTSPCTPLTPLAMLVTTRASVSAWNPWFFLLPYTALQAAQSCIRNWELIAASTKPFSFGSAVSKEIHTNVTQPKEIAPSTKLLVSWKGCTLSMDCLMDYFEKYGAGFPEDWTNERNTNMATICFKEASDCARAFGTTRCHAVRDERGNMIKVATKIA